MKVITFTGKPANYATIDEHVSRSGQPMYKDFKWLKEQGVTDIINFRSMGIPEIDFDEALRVKELGMRYHNIPTKTLKPNVKDVFKFLQLVENITKNNGKVHIHCFAGADRTGMYSFIYKSLKNMGSISENLQEWLKMGMHVERFSELIPWAVKFVKYAKQL